MAMSGARLLGKVLRFARGATLAASWVALACLLGSTTSFAASFRSGLDAYESGHFEAAARDWQEAAESGDAAAMRNLGHLYRWGKGVPQDFVRAEKWYRAAAEKGLDRAMLNLAALYSEGVPGVPRNSAEAARWYERAAEAGNPYAKASLAQVLIVGDGVPRNMERARRLLQAAVEGGVPGAEKELAALDKETEAIPLSPSERTQRSDANEQTEGSSGEKVTIVQSAPNHTTEMDGNNPPPQKVQSLARSAKPRVIRESEGVMAELGVFATKAEAQAAWNNLKTKVPELESLTPVLMEGFVPGKGDLVRLYLAEPFDRLIPLCAAVRRADPSVSCEVHRFYR